MNNNMMLMAQMLRTGGNPRALMQQMASRDPRMSQFMQMINGKTPQQLESIARNAAKERGVNVEDLMRQFGLK